MSDLISRQAAIDALAKFVPYAICDESTESYTNGLTDAYNLILQLPSAQPGITLESAIDYLHSIGWMQEHDRTLTESAQPEIIHCESCEHWKNEHICECLSRYGTFETPKNFYCGYGKENRWMI